MCLINPRLRLSSKSKTECPRHGCPRHRSLPNSALYPWIAQGRLPERSPAPRRNWLQPQLPRRRQVAQATSSCSLGRALGVGRLALDIPNVRRTQSIEQRMQDALHEDQLASDLENGRAPPIVQDLRRDALALLAPGFELADGARDLGSAGRTMARMARGYLREAESYGRGASSATQREKPVDTTDALVSDVCVELRHGQEGTVSIASRSERPGFDRIAAEAVLRASRLRALPLDAPPMAVCFRFMARFTTLPPLPVVGCGFEETTGEVSCFYPFKKIVEKRVDVIRVEPLPPG
jgi:hypothetical protein